MTRTLSLVFFSLLAIASLTFETSKTARSAGYADALPPDADNFDRRLSTKPQPIATSAPLAVETNPRLGTPEIIAPLQSDELLFAGSDGMSRPMVLRAFLKREAELIGVPTQQVDQLKVTADYTNPNGILSFVHLEQSIDGIPVFQGEAKGIFSPDGALFRVVNNLAPHVDESSPPSDFGVPEAAIVRAAADRGIVLIAELINRLNRSTDIVLRFEINGGETATAEKFYFPFATGEVRPAWRVMISDHTNLSAL